MLVAYIMTKHYAFDKILFDHFTEEKKPLLKHTRFLFFYSEQREIPGLNIFHSTQDARIYM